MSGLGHGFAQVPAAHQIVQRSAPSEPIVRRQKPVLDPAHSQFGDTQFASPQRKVLRSTVLSPPGSRRVAAGDRQPGRVKARCPPVGSRSEYRQTFRAISNGSRKLSRSARQQTTRTQRRVLRSFLGSRVTARHRHASPRHSIPRPEASLPHTWHRPNLMPWQHNFSVLRLPSGSPAGSSGFLLEHSATWEFRRGRSKGPSRPSRTRPTR